MDTLKDFERTILFIRFEGRCRVLQRIRFAFLECLWLQGEEEVCGGGKDVGRPVLRPMEWSRVRGLGCWPKRWQEADEDVYLGYKTGFVRIWGVRRKQKSRNPQGFWFFFP